MGKKVADRNSFWWHRLATLKEAEVKKGLPTIERKLRPGPIWSDSDKVFDKKNWYSTQKIRGTLVQVKSDCRHA